MEESHVKVAVLEERVTSIAEVFTRLESAIEKISDVSVDIKQMLAVHDERIASLDDRLSRTKDHTITLTETITKDAKDTVQRFHSLEHRIISGQNDLKQIFTAHVDENDKRIKTLENWRYVLVGMFLVIGTLFTLFAQNSVTITRNIP